MSNIGLAKSSGFAQGFAQGFGNTFPMSLQYITEKKKQDKIDNKADEFKLQAMEYAKIKDKNWSDGIYSQEERDSDIRWSIPFGAAMTEWVTATSTEARNLSTQELDDTMGEMDAFIALSEKLDFSNYDEMLAFRKNFTKFPKALMKYDAALRSIKAKIDKDKENQIEYFTSLPEVQAKYGENAEGTFVSGKGWVYKGEKEVGAGSKSPSDYVNTYNILGAMASSKGMTDERFQTELTRYAEQTGMDLEGLTRNDFLEGTTDEVDEETLKEDFNRAFFGTDGIMKEFQGMGGDLTEADKQAIVNNYNIMSSTFSDQLNKKAIEYLESINIDPQMEAPKVTDPVKKENIGTTFLNWIKGKKVTEEDKEAIVTKYDPQDNMKRVAETTQYTDLSEDKLWELVTEGTPEEQEEAKREANIRGYK